MRVQFYSEDQSWHDNNYNGPMLQVGWKFEIENITFEIIGITCQYEVADGSTIVNVELS